jgi:nucleoredoxin
MQSLVGETLVTRTGSRVPTVTALAGSKYVAVYCSAHWCPPCRQFTPLLGEFFQAHAANLKVAVVFATSDRDEKSFKDYFARCG